MVGRWHLIVPAGVLAGLAASPALVAAPRPPVLPASERATFDVVVEGTGTASRTVTLNGQLGACTIASTTRSTETYEYGRGRGLRVEFVRLGSGRGSVVLIRRVGRSPFAPTVFNVRATIANVAAGQAERAGPPEVCDPVVERVGDEELCGRRGGAENFALQYRGGRLSLRLWGDPLPPLPSPRLCGVNGVETASGPPTRGFAEPADLRPAPLSPGRIFGTARAFRVPLASPGVLSRDDAPIPGLVGSRVDAASHRAVVRFIRVRPG